MKLSDTFNQRYKVTFSERNEPVNQITAWLGDTPPTPSAGGGGYNAISLPMRSAVSVWQGRSGLFVMDIPIMLWDEQPQTVIAPTGGGLGSIATLAKSAALSTLANVHKPQSILQQANRLFAMWRPEDDTVAPPIIRVKAPGSSVPFQYLPYWISDFTWGAAIGDDDGDRIMQQLVVQVTEFRRDEQLQTIKLKSAKSTASSKASQKTYVVKRGDTLSAIAKRYDLPNGWRQLAAAQNPVITDPRSVKVGRRLVIPRA